MKHLYASLIAGGGAGGCPTRPVLAMARYEHLPIYKKAIDLLAGLITSFKDRRPERAPILQLQSRP